MYVCISNGKTIDASGKTIYAQYEYIYSILQVRGGLRIHIIGPMATFTIVEIFILEDCNKKIFFWPHCFLLIGRR